MDRKQLWLDMLKKRGCLQGYRIVNPGTNQKVDIWFVNGPTVSVGPKESGEDKVEIRIEGPFLVSYRTTKGTAPAVYSETHYLWEDVICVYILRR